MAGGMDSTAWRLSSVTGRRWRSGLGDRQSWLRVFLHPEHAVKSLRVKKMAGYDDVWELTWAPDGRATFEYGASVKEGHPHVRWRRVGTHDIFKRP